jgi:hypothetical protein
MLRVLTDAGQKVRGRAPFADGDGAFVVSAAIRHRRCVVYAPLGALVYTSPKKLSLEVSVWVARHGTPSPVGKAVLDAELPAPRELRVADYLSPLSSLAARILAAGPDRGGTLRRSRP